MLSDSYIKSNKHDRLAVSKLVTSMTKASIRSPYAHCLLIKYTSQVMEEDPNSIERGFYSYLESCLRNKNDMVIYEAARAICNLKNVTSRELTPAVTVLQMFLSSPKPSLRFAAVRTLNKVAQTHPLVCHNLQFGYGEPYHRFQSFNCNFGYYHTSEDRKRGERR